MNGQEQSNDKKILDEVREVMRLHHYSIHTERSYCEWIRRFVLYHRMRSRADLAGGESKIEAFLTHLAVDGQVASATQNQAMNALVFLYKRVLQQPLDQSINAVRADRKINVPVVLTREEVSRVIAMDDSCASKSFSEGQGRAGSGFCTRAWVGLPAVRVGEKISGSGTRLGVAVCISGARCIPRPAQ